MAASVQDLLLMAEAKNRRSPLVDLVQTAMNSYDTGVQLKQQRQNHEVDTAMKLIALQQAQQDMEAQKQMAEFAAQIERQREEQTKQGFNSVPGAPKPVLPTQKFTYEIEQDSKGRYSRKFKTVDATASMSSSASSYTPEQVKAISSGNPDELIKAFPMGVPKDALSASSSILNRTETQRQKLQKEDEDRIKGIRTEIKTSKSYNDWLSVKSASDNLLDAATNPNAVRSLGAIYSYIRALDPTSAVKGDEIKLAGEARSTAKKVEGFFRKMATGELLNPDEVRAMADWAKSKERMARKNAFDSNKSAIEQAKRNQYDLREINSDLFAEDEGGETKEQRKARLLAELSAASGGN